MKVVEKPGPTITTGLIKNNPFPRLSCGREQCLVPNCLDRCSKENVTYVATCNTCQVRQWEAGIENPVLPTYIGETSRTIYIRSKQHVNDCDRHLRLSYEDRQQIRNTIQQDNTYEKVSSWMTDHMDLTNRDDTETFNPRIAFSFNILRKHRDSMSRQIEEAVRINQSLDSKTLTDSNNIDKMIVPLNRRGECFGSRSRSRNFI